MAAVRLCLYDMNEEDKREIAEWLAGPRDHSEGAELYRRHGTNLMLRRQFTFNHTETSRKILIRELAKMAGLSEEDLKGMQRKAAFAEEIKKGIEGVSEKHPLQSLSEESKQRIRFREKFPFLSDEGCPDVLKVLVADMFTAYGRYRESFAALQEMADSDSGADALRHASDAVENYIEDRAIMEELVHYRDHHALLGSHPKVRKVMGIDDGEPDYAEMETSELVRKLGSANTNVSKARKALKEADTEEKRATAEERLERWRIRLEQIKAAIELRKKN